MDDRWQRLQDAPGYWIGDGSHQTVNRSTPKTILMGYSRTFVTRHCGIFPVFNTIVICVAGEGQASCFIHEGSPITTNGMLWKIK